LGNVREVILTALFLLPGLTLFSGGSAAQAESSDSAYNIKAAFIYNFAIYVDWPSGAFKTAEEPFVVGVVGSDAFAELLGRTLSEKTVRGHRFMVKRLAVAKNMRDCQIVFFSAQTHDVAAALSSLAATPTLTVGESAGFAESGGMINFLVDDNKLRFDINTEAGRRVKLAMSSRLLSLARRVR
jgi:hypothetical protein